MIFSNNETKISSRVIRETNSLFRKNPKHEIKYPTPGEIQQLKVFEGINKFQYGANLGLELGFRKGWFDDYDWIIRINPDVLIRNSTFITQQLTNENVDGIFVDCSYKDKRHIKLHTDFFMIRPNVLTQYWPSSDDQPFSNMVLEPWSKTLVNHEFTATKYFQPILNSDRFTFLQDIHPSNGFCRVRGPNSSVIHSHNNFPKDEENAAAPNTCKALDGFDVQ
jgi:hypothetical protein